MQLVMDYLWDATTIEKPRPRHARDRQIIDKTREIRREEIDREPNPRVLQRQERVRSPDEDIDRWDGLY